MRSCTQMPPPQQKWRTGKGHQYDKPSQIWFDRDAAASGTALLEMIHKTKSNLCRLEGEWKRRSSRNLEWITAADVQHGLWKTTQQLQETLRDVEALSGDQPPPYELAMPPQPEISMLSFFLSSLVWDNFITGAPAESVQSSGPGPLFASGATHCYYLVNSQVGSLADLHSLDKSKPQATNRPSTS